MDPLGTLFRQWKWKLAAYFWSPLDQKYGGTPKLLQNPSETRTSPNRVRMFQISDRWGTKNLWVERKFCGSRQNIESKNLSTRRNFDSSLQKIEAICKFHTKIPNTLTLTKFLRLDRKFCSSRQKSELQIVRGTEILTVLSKTNRGYLLILYQKWGMGKKEGNHIITSHFWTPLDTKHASKPKLLHFLP